MTENINTAAAPAASPKPVIAITGATAGVGRATARRFAAAGASLALIARDREALAETQAEVEALGGKAVGFALDVADAGAVLRSADEIVAKLGPLDLWINNAMVTAFAPLASITPDEFRRVTEVTYLGYVHGTMAALRVMRPRNQGMILQVGSALAYRGIPLQSAYCGAKHAIRGFVDSLRSELLHEGSAIRLSMVQLPAVNTPQFAWARSRLPHEPRPVAPVMKPEAIADAIFKAASRPRREYWVGVSTVKAIVGGFLLPAFVDRYLARHGIGAQQTTVPSDPRRADNLFDPVGPLHGVSGPFTAEARGTVAFWSGTAVRLVLMASGTLVVGALGFIVGYLCR